MQELPSLGDVGGGVFVRSGASQRGHSYKACELALQQLASKRFPLELLTTHRFGLKDTEYAIKSVGGEGAKDVVHVSLMPWM
jgi:threonine dehydrogenase-like Zn-dependent dehydrogenase